MTDALLLLSCLITFILLLGHGHPVLSWLNSFHHCCWLPPTEDMKGFVIFKHLFMSVEGLVHGWKNTALRRMSVSHSVTRRDREALARHDPAGEISVFL